MPSTFSTTLRLELPSNGEQSGIWGQTLNKDISLIEQAIAGITDIYLTGGNYTLSSFNGLEDEARSAVISCTGILSAAANVVAPSVQKTYIITNTAGANVTIKTSSGNGVTVLNGTSSLVYCDGTDFYTAVSLNNVIGNQTISGNEAIGANVTAGGNLTVTSNVTSFNGNLTFTSNTSIVTAGVNTGAYTPPTGTTAQRPTSPIGGMSRFNTDTGTYEIFNGAVWQAITGAYAVEYLLIAGGGGGGFNSFQGSGGGGAGGLLANVASVQPGTAYSIVVGSGGSVNAKGANSTAFSLTALGGGSGAGNSDTAVINGGSGGGRCTRDNPAENFGPGSGTSGQGFAGSSGISGYVGAGGGGASQTGQGTAGGSGTASSISGSSVFYAGGGGGGNRQVGSGGTGGAGGGGFNNTAGTANTGGGGAGGGSDPGAYTGTAGGSGVCILSYPSATQRATGGTVTTYTSSGTVYWVHTFTTSGTFTA